MHLQSATVVGVLMIGIGLVVTYGAITGSLAALIAAVVDPGVLGPASASIKKPLTQAQINAARAEAKKLAGM